MRRSLAVSLLAAALAAPAFAGRRAEPGVQILDKAVQAHGGLSRFQRLETVTYTFEETRFTEAGPVRSQGRRLFKFHDAGGFRGREERTGADPVVLSSAAAAEELFPLFVPQSVKDAGEPVRYVGLGRLGDKITQRLEAGAGVAALLIYVDPAGQFVDGFAAPAEAPTRVTILGGYQDMRGLFVPLRREIYDGNGRKIASVRLSDLQLNTFLDETIFRP